MSDKLDQLFAALRDRPDEALPGLEARVWARIDSRRASGALVAAPRGLGGGRL
ncbi:hypothetical protein ACRAWD_20690 [Caulobacter segnis]